jgi:hypothetical protein
MSTELIISVIVLVVFVVVMAYRHGLRVGGYLSDNHDLYRKYVTAEIIGKVEWAILFERERNELNEVFFCNRDCARRRSPSKDAEMKAEKIGYSVFLRNADLVEDAPANIINSEKSCFVCGDRATCQDIMPDGIACTDFVKSNVDVPVLHFEKDTLHQKDAAADALIGFIDVMSTTARNNDCQEDDAAAVTESNIEAAESVKE